MNSITLQRTKEIAKIAGLLLTPEETEYFHQSLQSIFEYVNLLKEVDTDGIAPLTSMANFQNVFREDTVAPSLPIEKVLGSSTKTNGNVFEVSAILK